VSIFSVKIRKANVNDVEQIKLLLERNFDGVMSEFHSESVLTKFKSHNSVESLTSQLKWKSIYIAEQGGEVIATGAFVNFGNAAEPKYSISNLYVKPELHSTGVGRRLFDRLFQDAKEQNADTFHVPSSINAIGVYEKMGFTVDEEQLEKDDEITWMTMRV
jgi:N-acetylglutamate synthase-like GNAT family acetyltransferase